MKKISGLAVSLLMLCLFGTACGMTGQEETKSSEDHGWCYEAVFLDNSAVGDLFGQIREKTPYQNMTADFHVSTEFEPEEHHPEWYGEKVSVHIVAYKAQTVTDDNGQPTGNEGFKVEVKAENPELQEFLDSLGKNFHITGSYEDGAKYTEKVDFSDGLKIDIYPEGTFGIGYQDGTLVLE